MEAAGLISITTAGLKKVLPVPLYYTSWVSHLSCIMHQISLPQNTTQIAQCFNRSSVMNNDATEGLVYTSKLHI